jgi:hypothetical protein
MGGCTKTASTRTCSTSPAVTQARPSCLTLSTLALAYTTNASRLSQYKVPSNTQLWCQLQAVAQPQAATAAVTMPSSSKVLRDRKRQGLLAVAAVSQRMLCSGGCGSVLSGGFRKLDPVSPAKPDGSAGALAGAVCLQHPSFEACNCVLEMAYCLYLAVCTAYASLNLKCVMLLQVACGCDTRAGVQQRGR